MDLNTQLKKYAQLIAKVGLNVQEGLVLKHVSL